MDVLGQPAAMAVLDGLACAFLAAAAACRARSFGSHFTGAIVLGCLCGLVGPLLREAFLHGQPETGRIASEMPAVALTGALAAVAARAICKSPRLFFWLDSSSIGLAAGVGSICSLPALGIVGAVTLGMINALAPGLVRDMALGDTAMLVDKSWYATAAALGCLATLGAFILIIALGSAAWLDQRAGEMAALTGFCVALGLRIWKGRSDAD